MNFTKAIKTRLRSRSRDLSAVIKNVREFRNEILMIIRVHKLSILLSEKCPINDTQKIHIKTDFCKKTYTATSQSASQKKRKVYYTFNEDFYFILPAQPKPEGPKSDLFLTFFRESEQDSSGPRHKNRASKLIEIANFTLGFDDVLSSEELFTRGVALNPDLDGEIGEVSFGVFFDIPKINLENFSDTVRTMNKLSNYLAKKKKDKEQDALNELISSFFSNDKENNADALKHEQIYTRTYNVLYLFSERKNCHVILLMMLSQIVCKSSIDRKYADLLRDLMKFVLKEITVLNDYISCKLFSELCASVFYGNDCLFKFLRTSQVFQSYEYFQDIFVAIWLEKSSKEPERDHRQLDAIVRKFVGTMFLNGISLENINKFMTDITRTDEQKDHFDKALQKYIEQLGGIESRSDSECSADDKNENVEQRPEDIKWIKKIEYDKIFYEHKTNTKVKFSRPEKGLAAGDDAEDFWKLLGGETTEIIIENIYNSTMGMPGRLSLTNYRMQFRPKRPKNYKELPPDKMRHLCFLPIYSISKVEMSKVKANEFNYTIFMKDCRQIMFALKVAEKKMIIFHEKLQKLMYPSGEHKTFAFAYRNPEPAPFNGWELYTEETEFRRQKLSLKWAMSKINANYKICETYPKKLIVPNSISLFELRRAARARTKHRLPVLTYYCAESKAAIIRSSQPKTTGSQKYLSKHYNVTHIIDARPKINAVANKAAGGGYENTKYDIIFCGIPNVHGIRESLYKFLSVLRIKENGLDSLSPGDENFLQEIRDSSWLENLQLVLLGARYAVNIVYNNQKNVLIHCSDGWDRTAQISALAQLLLDPYYRTLAGFIVLIEKDFVSFGHMFSTRNGNAKKDNTNQRSPIFLQFIDCVFQLLQNFSVYFEFNDIFLEHIAEESVSCRYGTFLFDNEYTREKYKVKSKTVSIWTEVLSNPHKFRNPFFVSFNDVISPDVRMFNFKIWPFYYRTNITCEYEIPPLIAASIIFEKYKGLCEKSLQSLQSKEKELAHVKNALLKVVSSLDQNTTEETASQISEIIKNIDLTGPEDERVDTDSEKSGKSPQSRKERMLSEIMKNPPILNHTASERGMDSMLISTPTAITSDSEALYNEY